MRLVSNQRFQNDNFHEIIWTILTKLFFSKPQVYQSWTFLKNRKSLNFAWNIILIRYLAIHFWLYLKNLTKTFPIRVWTCFVQYLRSLIILKENLLKLRLIESSLVFMQTDHKNDWVFKNIACLKLRMWIKYLKL